VNVEHIHLQVNGEKFRNLCVISVVISQIKDNRVQSLSSRAFNMDKKKPHEPETAQTKECIDPSSNNALLENANNSSSQNQDGHNDPTEKTPSPSVADNKDERPKIRRKRSSSLSSLLQLRQFLESDGDQCERIKLRRVSSIPMTYNSGEQETQLEDGLLTTTLCSTEL